MKSTSILATAALVFLLSSSAVSTTASSPFQEDLAVIVNKSNPVDNISMTELRQIFLAEKSRWSNGRKITIVMREPGRAEREAILRLICRMRDQDFNRHFLNARFTGATLEEPKLLTSADGMLKFVFNAPGAIGYARASEVDSSVKALRIDGRAPGEAGYKLKL